MSFENLDCCNSLLYGVSRRVLAVRLQRVQNVAARLVFRSSRRQHINATPVLRQASCRVPSEFKTIKALYGKNKLHVTLDQTCRNHGLRSHCAPTLKPALKIPRTRSVKYCGGNRALSAAAPALWNGLPVHITCAKTLVRD